MRNYVIIGNGVAGTTAAENIRKQDSEGNINVFSDEDIPFYYRLRLSEFISGDISEAELVAKKMTWYEDRNISLKLKTRVEDVKLREKTAITEDNRRFAFDRLLIATGSHSFIPPIQGSENKGVFALRDIQDARDISAYTKKVEDIILIGGGLLGLEAGYALKKLGKRIMVVEFFPRLLPKQLDVDGARRLQEIMEDMGFSFRLGAKTQEITGEGQVNGVLLEGGESISGGMVVISAGVRPNMVLAESLALSINKGILVDEHLQTSQSGIYAAGDVAEYKGIPYGIWPAAMEQGKIAGINMAGGDMTYDGTTMANTLKVAGVDLASAGNIDAENEFEARVKTEGRIYRKIVIKDNHIVGCIMLGETKGFNQITKMMAEKTDISQIGDLL
ncbi:MAG: NAD(P)/FAD-dependent oxidoreductase [Deltaproteobacteria bacterium]|nr:NAD(P)/FAD-dependent oxidoreductase [Deltaproteobacteria bacterium]